MSETATPPPAPSPAPVPHPAFGGPPAASGSSLIQISADEFQRLRGVESQLGQLMAKHQADLATKEAERLSALAEAGKGRQALDEQRSAWEKKVTDLQAGFEQVRGLYHGKTKAAEIATSLAGVQFAGETPQIQSAVAANFRTLIDHRFETIEDGQGNLVVREKGTGRPAADAMKELLNAPEYQNFFQPKSRGGSGTDGTRSASAQQQQSDNPHQPGSVQWYAYNFERNQQATTGLMIRK